MPFEKFDLENLNKERRKAIAKSIRTISVEELKSLAGDLFRYADDPWRETFFRFIAENAGATFHHAVTRDGVNIVYCRSRQRYVVPARQRNGAVAGHRPANHEGDDRRRPLSTSIAGFAFTIRWATRPKMLSSQITSLIVS